MLFVIKDSLLNLKCYIISYLLGSKLITDVRCATEDDVRHLTPIKFFSWLTTKPAISHNR